MPAIFGLVVKRRIAFTLTFLARSPLGDFQAPAYDPALSSPARTPSTGCVPRPLLKPADHGQRPRQSAQTSCTADMFGTTAAAAHPVRRENPRKPAKTPRKPL
jgi:hypothetical protein